MLKIVGIAVIFISAKIFYENYVENKEENIKKIEDIILFMNLIYVNVMELKMPLEIGVNSLKFKISAFVDDFINDFSMTNELSDRKSLIKTFMKLDIDKKIKTETVQFLKIVGTNDKETVLNYKNVALDSLNKRLQEIKSSKTAKCKTMGALTFGTTTAIVIMLL